MAPRILAFRHVKFEGLGLIEPPLRAAGCHIDYADLYRPGAIAPDVKAYDALIFMGGPMSVNDDLAYLRLEEEYIRAASERGTPVLGVCLGAQLIARALGAAVRRNPVKEIGWFPIEFTPAARARGLFQGLVSETVFHWHGETFDLPPGAELLASSERCRNQAFCIGSRVYALQFHLEVTPQMVAAWCLEDDNCGDVRELDGPLDPQRNSARLAILSHSVFGRWCGIISSS